MVPQEASEQRRERAPRRDALPPAHGREKHAHGPLEENPGRGHRRRRGGGGSGGGLLLDNRRATRGPKRGASPARDPRLIPAVSAPDDGQRAPPFAPLAHRGEPPAEVRLPALQELEDGERDGCVDVALIPVPVVAVAVAALESLERVAQEKEERHQPRGPARRPRVGAAREPRPELRLVRVPRERQRRRQNLPLGALGERGDYLVPVRDDEAKLRRVNRRDGGSTGTRLRFDRPKRAG